MTEQGPRRWGAAALQRARQLSEETTTQDMPTPSPQAKAPRRSSRSARGIALLGGVLTALLFIGVWYEFRAPTLQAEGLHQTPDFQGDLLALSATFLEQRVLDRDCFEERGQMEEALPRYLTGLMGPEAVGEYRLLCGQDGWAAVIHLPAGVPRDAIVAAIDQTGRIYPSWHALPADGQTAFNATVTAR